MNKDKLARIIGELDDRIVSESAGARISSGRSETVPEKKRRGIGRWIEAAACLLIVTGMIGAAVILPSLTKKSGPASTGAETYISSNILIDTGNDMPNQMGEMIPVIYKSALFCWGYNGNVDGWNKAVVIRSKNELTEYIEERKEKNPLVVPDVEDEKLISQITDAYLKWEKDMLDFSDSYSDEYFETHDLIVLPIEAASGSFRYMLSSLVRQEAGVVTVVVNTYMPEVYTDDLREFCWLIETGEKLGADETVEVSFCETDDTAKASYFRVGVYDDDCTEPKCTLIRSRDELEKHLQRYLENSDELDAMKDTLDRYTDDYFKTNYLAMVGASVGSGSYRLNVRSLLNDWSGIEVMLETVTEKGANVTADEASWTVIIEGEGILPDDIKASVRSDFREVDSEEFEQYR